MSEDGKIACAFFITIMMVVAMLCIAEIATKGC